MAAERRMARSSSSDGWQGNETLAPEGLCSPSSDPTRDAHNDAVAVRIPDTQHCMDYAYVSRASERHRREPTSSRTSGRR